jgi:hypothetical protein
MLASFVEHTISLTPISLPVLLKPISSLQMVVVGPLMVSLSPVFWTLNVRI